MTTTTAPATFLLSLLSFLLNAGYTASTTVDAGAGQRVMRIEGQDGNAHVEMDVEIDFFTGEVVGGTYVRTYSDDEVYPARIDGAQDLATTVGTLVAETLTRHQEDQPQPEAGTLVIYHGSIGSVRGVYTFEGYTDREGRHFLRPTWSHESRDMVRVSSGCRTITPLPLP